MLCYSGPVGLGRESVCWDNSSSVYSGLAGHGRENVC